MRLPRITLNRRGLFVLLRFAGEGRRALGFVIKPRSEMLFSERWDYYAHAFTFGPLYFRTFAKRPA